MAAADRYLNEGVAAAAKGNIRFFLRFLLDALGYLASGTDPRRAARLFGAAEMLREQLGSQVFPYEKDEYDRYLQQARSQLDAESWKAAWREGRAMTVEQSIEYALQSR